jgi:glycosyltransferase involved in cell wall biosynthesis
MHIAIGYNTSHYVWILRANLLRTLLAAGHKITVVAPRDAYTSKLLSLGVGYIEVSMRMNRNPFTDLWLMLRLRVALGRINPQIYLGFTAKPNIYGSLAARSLGIPVVNNIAGLGSSFSSRWLMTFIMSGLYRIALKRSALVFFQNTDDRKLFVDHAILPAGAKIDLLPGSGVDLLHFRPALLPSHHEIGPKFLFVGRLLWEKGVGEFVAAARLISKRFPQARFHIMGSLDVDNVGAVPPAQVQSWQQEGIVTYLGFVEDVRLPIADADCVVLPSYYREGTPRSLLEAGAMARPIITTDSVGCRDTVEDGVSGFLCRPRSPESLAEKMAAFCEMSPEARYRMGLAGRARMESSYDEAIVLNKYLAAITTLSRANLAQPTVLPP